MTILYAIIFGLVQGLTEFLPVSSSGHLVLLNNIFGASNNFLFFTLLLHLATLLAVFVVLRKEILYLIKHPFSNETKRLVIATIPTVIIVLIFETFVKDLFGGGLLKYCFLITALLLFVTDMLSKRNESSKEFRFKSAFLMGIAQGIAVLPGISRSGATICTGLLCGEDRKQTAKFSFLMSVPIILASMLYEILGAVRTGQSLIDAGTIFPTIVAFVVAFITGIFAIKFMIKIVEKARYFWFSIYLILLVILMIVLGL